ncbi:MAG: hypothetical protein P5694_00165 [Limnospira sp. PMC 1286.21]|uniref:Uncharacterized protein n=1 Tax=Limnospira fusiformis PMC 851.14 TaxID=2219512 RepID=A0ABU9EIB5_LIMFS|nr:MULTISPECIES: hypothetical protein [Limnospira]EKD07461.1 hypothetical protein SPLC1_S411280 [Arthrospira platensis C1]MDY7052209.1 hypothetical protein [Limnospira fusiformis LS22]QJB25787.1 hypothetical protein HFV01_08250 [Limnospira fusiformis SAG 85.79]MDT9186376.1 hypothetical protein [Limnospira sp. PMC 894.15]MDT9196753.1 hypothetical protein [Limnospira sp. PMC 1042.18]
MLFDNQTNSTSLSVKTLGGDSVVRIIGDRSSGKTTYLASLAYWPNASPDNPVQTVSPVGEDSEELVNKARDILEQGLLLEPTNLHDIDAVKDYTLSITLKDRFSWLRGSGKMVQINVSCKDYSGEFFRDLVHKSGDPMLDDYLDDCCLATGLMVLVDGTAHRKDKDYCAGIEKLLVELDRAELKNQHRRIAFVLTKCEQSELWVNRHEPKKLANMRFPKLSAQLQSYSKLNRVGVEYFTTSAFGILGKQYPEPNSKRLKRSRDGTTSVIKKPRVWRPFGLVAPIYWLCTGKRHPELDRD